MNNKTFVIGLGKGAMRDVANVFHQNEGNTAFTRPNDFKVSYLVADDMTPEKAVLGAQYTIESESWVDIQSEIESVYTNSDNSKVDVFKGTGYGNVFPVLDELKAAYPDSSIYLVFKKQKFDDKLSNDPYHDNFPNLAESITNMQEYVTTNNPEVMSFRAVNYYKIQ